MKIVDKLIELKFEQRTGRYIRVDEELTWFPVIFIDATGYYMGLSKENREWVVEVASGIHHLDKPQLFVYVMVLLEEPFELVYGRVNKFLNDISIDEDPFLFFPFIDIMKAGFEKKSDYWAALSFEWYKKIPFDKKMLLKESILKIIGASWASQKIRHKAWKEIKILERMNADTQCAEISRGKKLKHARGADLSQSIKSIT